MALRDRIVPIVIAAGMGITSGIYIWQKPLQDEMARNIALQKASSEGSSSTSKSAVEPPSSGIPTNHAVSEHTGAASQCPVKHSTMSDPTTPITPSSATAADKPVTKTPGGDISASVWSWTGIWGSSKGNDGHSK